MAESMKESPWAKILLASRVLRWVVGIPVILAIVLFGASYLRGFGGAIKGRGSPQDTAHDCGRGAEASEHRREHILLRRVAEKFPCLGRIQQFQRVLKSCPTLEESL
jgi:hypothetical protein